MFKFNKKNTKVIVDYLKSKGHNVIMGNESSFEKRHHELVKKIRLK